MKILTTLFLLLLTSACTSSFPEEVQGTFLYGEWKKPMVYLSASFRSRVLTGSGYFYPESDNSREAFMEDFWDVERSCEEDLSALLNRLPLRKLAKICCRGDGKVYFIPGERLRLTRPLHITSGPTPGKIKTRMPNVAEYPPRFIAEKNVELSIFMENILLLCQLYMDGRIRIIGDGEYATFCWTQSAYDREESPGVQVSLLTERDYPALSLIKLPAGKVAPPSFPFEKRCINEPINTVPDFLRGREGCFRGSMTSPREIFTPPYSVFFEKAVPQERTLRRFCAWNAAYREYLRTVLTEEEMNRNITGTEILLPVTEEILRKLCQEKKAESDSSFIKYEYLTLHTDVKNYYRELMDYYRSIGQKKRERIPKLIYRQEN